MKRKITDNSVIYYLELVEQVSTIREVSQKLIPKVYNKVNLQSLILF